MKDYQPELDFKDLEYIASFMRYLDEASDLFKDSSTEPINVYSHAEPLGYIYYRVDDDGKTKHYFVAGDRYRETE